MDNEPKDPPEGEEDEGLEEASEQHEGEGQDDPEEEPLRLSIDPRPKGEDSDEPDDARKSGGSVDPYKVFGNLPGRRELIEGMGIHKMEELQAHAEAEVGRLNKAIRAQTEAAERMSEKLREQGERRWEIKDAALPRSRDLVIPPMDDVFEAQAEDMEIKRRTANAMEANLELLRRANDEQSDFRWWSIRLSWGIFIMASAGVLVTFCS